MEHAMTGDPSQGPGEGAPRQLDRYEIVKELGTGGMATVYLARVRGPGSFERYFAIKRIHPHLARDKRFVDMFLDEARIAAAMHHPNLTQVFELGGAQQVPYLVLELLHGTTLSRAAVECVSRFGAMPPRVAARVVAAAAAGLHHAHEARDTRGRLLEIVHRDVSPSNIFLTFDGEVKVTDFGIARAANRLSQTATGSWKGKAGYMAPEQLSGAALDRRADIWALGIVLWEITTGRRLFRTSHPLTTLKAIQENPIPRPSEIIADYPPALEAIVMMALERDPDRRIATAEVFENQLRAVDDQLPEGPADEVGPLMHSLFEETSDLSDFVLMDSQTSFADDPSSDVSGWRARGGAEEGAAGGPGQDLSIDIELGGVALGGVEAVPTRAPGVHRRARSSGSGGRSRRQLIWLAAAATAVGALVVVTVGAMSKTSNGAEEAPSSRPSPQPVVAGASGAAAGEVWVRSRPSGAEVWLDGADVVGATPLRMVDVAPGRHRIRVSLAGFAPAVATFDLDNREEITNLNYTLRAEVPVVGSDPSVASTDDGLAAAASPESASDDRAAGAAVASAPTKRRAVRRPSRGTGQAARDPAAGSQASPAIAGPAELSVLSVPWSRVWVGDQAPTTTPLRGVVVASGAVRVRYRVMDQGEVRTTTVQLEPGASRTIRLDTRVDEEP